MDIFPVLKNPGELCRHPWPRLVATCPCSFFFPECAMDPLVPRWLAAVLQAVEPPPRTLDVLEVFSGKSHLWQACAAAGLAARGFDHCDSWEEDITTFEGFVLLSLLLLSVEEKGLVWFASPCSWWVFFSSSNHQRSAENSWAGKAGDRNVPMCSKLITSQQQFQL